MFVPVGRRWLGRGAGVRSQAETLQLLEAESGELGEEDPRLLLEYCLAPGGTASN